MPQSEISRESNLTRVTCIHSTQNALFPLKFDLHLKENGLNVYIISDFVLL